MSDLDQDSSDTDRLIGRLLDGLLDAQETGRLGVLLKARGTTRDRYCDLVMLHSLLQWRGMGGDIGLSLRQDDDDTPSGTDLNAAMIMPAIRIDDSIATDQPSPGSPMSGAMSGPSLEDLEIPAAQEAIAEPAEAASSGSGAISRKRWNFTRPWLLAASVLVGAALVAITLAVMRGRSHVADIPMLSGAIDARWDDAPAGLADGTALPLQRVISLRSGWAELAYPNGVVVTIEGPARFSIRAGQTLSLDSGKLVALVPQAGHGFAVSTPSARVVDLGTEFGVAVSSTGETDVHTFRGTVAVSPLTSGAATAATFVTAGLASRVTPAGSVSQVSVNPDAFVRPQQFADWNVAPHGAGYELWHSYSDRLRHDPDLVAYYTFDRDDSSNRLPNLSLEGSALDGALTGDGGDQRPAWTTGRWPEKGALAFGGTGHQRVEIPAGKGSPLDFSRGNLTASPFTICAWIRRGQTASEGYPIIARGPGFFEQFVLETVRGQSMRAWVRGFPQVQDEPTYVRESTTPADAGWQHVALTYDPIQGNLVLYRNGVSVASAGTVPSSLRQTDGPIIVGCRQGNVHHDGLLLGDAYFPSMNGSIDELAIFRQALSADRIQAMYLAERP